MSRLLTTSSQETRSPFLFTEIVSFDADPQWFMIFTLASESVLLALVLYKWWECRRIYRDLSEVTNGERLLTVMVGDSVKYYISYVHWFLITWVICSITNIGCYRPHKTVFS